MNMISNTALARVNEHSASRAILAVFLCSFLGASCQRNQSLSGEQQKGTGESPSGSEAPPTLVASSARADNEKSSGFQGTKWGMSETAFCNAVKSGAVIHGPLPPSGRGRCYVVNRPSPGEVMYSFSTTIQGNPVLGGAWFEESVGLYKIDLDFSTIREPGEVTDATVREDADRLELLAIARIRDREPIGLDDDLAERDSRGEDERGAGCRAAGRGRSRGRARGRGRDGRAHAAARAAGAEATATSCRERHDREAQSTDPAHPDPPCPHVSFQRVACRRRNPLPHDGTRRANFCTASVKTC